MLVWLYNLRPNEILAQIKNTTLQRRREQTRRHDTNIDTFQAEVMTIHFSRTAWMVKCCLIVNCQEGRGQYFVMVLWSKFSSQKKLLHLSFGMSEDT